MIQGYEIEYQILNKTYSVFLQSQAAVDDVTARLKSRNRRFTVREVVVNEDTGKIESRRECFYCSQIVTDEDEYTKTGNFFAHNVCIPDADSPSSLNGFPDDGTANNVDDYSISRDPTPYKCFDKTARKDDELL